MYFPPLVLNYWIVLTLLDSSWCWKPVNVKWLGSNGMTLNSTLPEPNTSFCRTTHLKSKVLPTTHWKWLLQLLDTPYSAAEFTFTQMQSSPPGSSQIKYEYIFRFMNRERKTFICHWHPWGIFTSELCTGPWAATQNRQTSAFQRR